MYVNFDMSQTEAGVDKFCVIRSHTRISSQFLKLRIGVGVEKIKLRTTLICTLRD